ncbi:MAG: hypothetical protein CR984_02900 [Proteobacteria bacterium]|nr:MAG: hypothetical protein CR984_02900 [Pseudomonadota bacterium]PIE68081.1 MAG: hypothetical protein CSA23_00810 [Deltaproteobacteria bacterium]
MVNRALKDYGYEQLPALQGFCIRRGLALYDAGGHFLLESFHGSVGFRTPSPGMAKYALWLRRSVKMNG